MAVSAGHDNFGGWRVTQADISSFPNVGTAHRRVVITVHLRVLILYAGILHNVRQELKYRIAADLDEVIFRLEVIGVCLLLNEYLAIPVVAVINIMVEICSHCCRGCIHTRC